ncbi:hypothetical protein LV716_12525 [Flagellimonas sp. HMM57]|uniref:hypothetical protein n=1 Tax=unclassified Flagellimonas TaxID=2644544 RepID=UPI0013D2D518|nr:MULTISPECIES: hypothetical protein [unclassified Flagellimonas]UII75078.1 hypothetical protein LV716_12525 [Flagellimonas sp. HMM57]
MKKMFFKIEKSNNLSTLANKFLVVLLSIITLSCSNDDNGIPPADITEISQDIKNLIYFRGDEKAPTVLIAVPGGPSPELATDIIDDLAQDISRPQDILTITVHQAQTLNSNILEGNDITLDQAINFNAESIEMLSEVITYFKNQGRTVYVAGISFGAFVTQEFIAQQGIDAADDYLIITGRLDINDAIWQGLAEGKNAFFENGVTPIVDDQPFVDAFNRNEARMFAGLAMNRYTEQFNTIESLSNITYIYGETDMAVGSLTVEEVAFLQSKNANILSGNGGHDLPFEDFLKQGFSEAFGIVLP